MVYFDLLNVNVTSPLDSARIRNGRFHAKIPLKETSFFLVRLKKNNFVTLMGSPGDKIYFTADSLFLPAGYQVSGSNQSSLIKILDDRLRQTVKQTDSIADIYKKVMNKPGFDTLKPQLEEEYNNIINEQHKFSVSFILSHMHDLAAIKAIYQKIDDNSFVLNSIRDIQYMKILSDTLSKYYPDLRITKALVSDYKREMNNYKQYRLSEMAKHSGTVGSLDLALPNINGDTVTLSSLKGKYVLLSFWASWCDQCVNENNEFTSLYNKYHSKGFEIYQVSLDYDVDTWTKFVRFNEIPWISVFDAGYPQSKAATKYNVQQPPRNFFLTPQGDIIATDLHGRNLRIKLSQIFGS